MRYSNSILLAGALASMALPLTAQEAASGIDLRATVSAQAVYSKQFNEDPRDGSSLVGGVRSILYPTLKFGEHWSITGSFEAISRPYNRSEYETAGNGMRGRVLSAAVGYSSVWNNGSVIVRAGQMTSAFGAFLLRYDDAENPLLTAPSSYGYYEGGVQPLGLAP